MILFFVSFLLVFLSSYLITSVIAPKKSSLGVIYLLLIIFSQIVLTFEILSLFTLIKIPFVLGVNVLFLIIGAFLWFKQGKLLWSLDYKNFHRKILNALKLDKSLMVLYIGFCVLIFSAIFLAVTMPLTNADAECYHVARSVFWVLQGSLNHFDIADVRNLCLPINSEIIYAWILLFTKKAAFFGCFSFAGYLLAITSIYNILGYLGYSARKKLWVIFILSSFSSVIVQMSGTETDIIIAGLVLSSIFLFWNALKSDKKLPLFMSSLAYALAVGTKSTALIMIPGTAFLMLALCSDFKKYKPCLYFLGFGFINFLIFSSYNYILNFIHFSNFISPASFMIVSKNYYGIKGLIANFIKHIFLFFDFSGFKWGLYLNSYIENLRLAALSFFHVQNIPDGIYSLPYKANSSLLEALMGAGILGMLVYIPTLIWAFLKPVFKPKSKKVKFNLLFASVFIINLLVLSYVLAYMVFSVRFIAAFMVVSSTFLVYSYCKKMNIFKFIMILFSLYYLIAVSTHIWVRPLVKVLRNLYETQSISYVRDNIYCGVVRGKRDMINQPCVLVKTIREEIPPDNKILVLISTSQSIYSIKALEFEGYKMDFKTLEDYSNIDFNEYPVMLVSYPVQSSTYIKYPQNAGKKKNNDENVQCMYTNNQSLKNPLTLSPFQVRCKLTEKFLKKNNIKTIKRLRFVDFRNKKIDTFFLYRNKNIPLK